MMPTSLMLQAVEELAALPPEAHERGVAEQILLNLHHALGNKASRTTEEQEFIVTMQNTWEKAREEGHKEGHKKGRKEGRNEGLAEEGARAVLTALRVRGIAVPEPARERILAEKDRERLERWHERAILAASVADVVSEPS
ncbi:MAG: Yae1 family protein [Myxococcales bacterium]